MSKCVKFPSIDQFRSVIRNVKHKASYQGMDDNGQPIFTHVIFPTLTFFGTVKSHGTNASIRQDVADSELIYQSRERVITPLDDNAGFATHCTRLGADLVSYFARVRGLFGVPADKACTIYGEWCGGNIQAGVAINGLDKMFLPFAVRIGVEEETKWIRANDEDFDQLTKKEFSFYDIGLFETFSVDVNFNEPELAQNTFVELTIKVEEECPIGKYFGKSGIGEGIVWFCASSEWGNSDFVFKTKGEKHSASKVKTIAAVDVEKVNKMRDLVDLIMTENRMEQMLTVMKDKEGLEAIPQNLGTFIRTCMADAFKEETDTIIQNGFEPKEFTKGATVKVRNWYLARI